MSLERIVVLGRLGIEREGNEAPGPGLPGRRAELVFAYLAVEHRRTVSRDELADELWPDVLPGSWAAALRGVVSEVRRFLANGGVDPAEALAVGRGGYQLRLPARLGVDVDQARTAVAAARMELAAGMPAVAAEHAGRAGDAVRLPFLPRHDGDWVNGVRADLHALRVEALEVEARAQAEAGDLRAAVAAAQQLVVAEPFKEPAHRLLIRMLGATGDRAGATGAYEHCARILSSELGMAPSPETHAAFRAAVDRAPSVDGAPPGPSVPRSDGLGIRSVLVVEDHGFQRRTAVRLLHGLGITDVSEAEDGAAALKVLGRSGVPDVIVCDVDMPGMDGVEFICRVAERRLASAVIIASGLDLAVVRAVEAVTEGSGLALLGAIEKPLTSRRLAALLASHRPDPAARQADAEAAVTVADVTRALDEGRLDVRFRPTVDLGGGRVSGAQVLAGWHDAAGGWVGVPEALAGMNADEPGGRFVDHALDLACTHLAAFAHAGLDLAVSVRIPGPCLADIGLADRFAAIVRRGGADTARVICVTGERALRADAPTLAALTRLRLKGFGLCAEPFVAASISAEQLGPLPLTAIRLAAGLVSGAGDDRRRAAALEEALEGARGRGLAVIAAGCDSAADFELLLRLGCGQAEGAYIAEPMPGDELPTWAGRWSPPAPVGGAM